MKISLERIITIDQYLDYIPFLSTASNLIHLFQKCIYKCLPKTTQKSRYWTYIHNKNTSHCIILLYPFFGNLYVFIFKHFKPKSLYKKITDLKINLVPLINGVSDLSYILENLKNPDRRTPTTKTESELFFACKNNDFEKAEILINKGTRFDFFYYGKTPLMIACFKSHFKIVNLLLQKTDNSSVLKSINYENMNAIHFSINSPLILNALLSREKDFKFVNQKNIDGDTPLHLALQFSEKFINKIEAEAKIKTDSLAYAFLTRHLSALCLLQYGADSFIKSGTCNWLQETFPDNFQLPKEMTWIVLTYLFKNPQKTEITPFEIALKNGFYPLIPKMLSSFQIIEKKQPEEQKNVANPIINEFLKNQSHKIELNLQEELKLAIDSKQNFYSAVINFLKDDSHKIDLKLQEEMIIAATDEVLTLYSSPDLNNQLSLEEIKTLETRFKVDVNFIKEKSKESFSELFSDFLKINHQNIPVEIQKQSVLTVLSYFLNIKNYPNLAKKLALETLDNILIVNQVLLKPLLSHGQQFQLALSPGKC